MKEIKAIDSWEQLTVAQFEELCRLQEEHPADSAKYIIEYLYDIPDAEQLPIIEYSTYVAGLQKFIGEPVLKAKLTPSATYTIHGRLYRVDITPADFSTPTSPTISRTARRRSSTCWPWSSSPTATSTKTAMTCGRCGATSATFR